jgi:hypothetical protein
VSKKLVLEGGGGGAACESVPFGLLSIVALFYYKTLTRRLVVHAGTTRKIYFPLLLIYTLCVPFIQVLTLKL